MDNFNIAGYFKKQYIAEAFDFDKYNKVTDQYKKELKSMGIDYNAYVSMRDYSQEGRSEGDKYKGKGFGDIHFIYRDELPEDDFQKAVKFLKDKGFEITSESNYYEVEYDNDRAWMPRIKFQFDIEKAEELLKEAMAVFSSEEDEDKYIEKMVAKTLEKEKEKANKKKKLKENRAQDLADSYSLKELNDFLQQLYGEMEQEAEPEGGPIADQYADEIYQYEEAIRIKKGVGQRGRKDITYDQAIGREDITDETGTYTLRPDGTKDYKRITPMTRDEFEKSSKFDRMEEGSCGYSEDGTKKDKPAGPHLLRLEKFIKETYKNHQKEKNNKK